MLTDVHQLLILDVMMGGMSGFLLAEKLRKEGSVIPIIFLTAKNSENDMLTGFSLGGDDYISKPFSVKELLARVKALLKRSALIRIPAETRWSYKGITIDIPANRVTIDEKEISLTKKEFDILSLWYRPHPTCSPVPRSWTVCGETTNMCWTVLLMCISRVCGRSWVTMRLSSSTDPALAIT